MGYDRGRPKLWRLAAFTSKAQPDWKKPRRPRWSAAAGVCDNDGGLTNAVRARFPDAELYLCAWHLRHALERLMGKLRTEQPEHQEVIDEPAGRHRGGVHRPVVLDAVHRALPRRRHPASERVAEHNGTDRRRAVQSRRGPPASRPADTPPTTSPLDAFINLIRAAIQPRAYGLKNRERTNRMLMLV